MTTPPPSANTLDLRPLMFETFVCTLAVMSFVALVGPLARKLGLAPWQAGAAVTAGTRLVPGTPDRRRRAASLFRPRRGAQHRARLR
ncbi:hypothetical protein M770_14125 [Pseudomonas aeruginosa VRFPA03]|nr:hypothetical protein M770_14125 [Pseudomonas aeruginosa VRFPA03]